MRDVRELLGMYLGSRVADNMSPSALRKLAAACLEAAGDEPVDTPKIRKPVQISVSPDPLGNQSVSVAVIADDGSMWLIEPDDNWALIPDLPQDPIE